MTGGGSQWVGRASLGQRCLLGRNGLSLEPGGAPSPAGTVGEKSTLGVNTAVISKVRSLEALGRMIPAAGSLKENPKQHSLWLP